MLVLFVVFCLIAAWGFFRLIFGSTSLPIVELLIAYGGTAAAVITGIVWLALRLLEHVTLSWK